MIDYLARAMEQDEEDREEAEMGLTIQTAKRLFRGTDRVSTGEESTGTTPVPTGAERKRSRRKTPGATAIVTELRDPVAEAAKVKKTAAKQGEMGAREERSVEMAETREGVRTLDMAVNDALVRRERAERSADAGSAPSQSQIETLWSLAGTGNGPASAPEAAVLRRTLRQAGGVLRTTRSAGPDPTSLSTALRRVRAGEDFARRERRSLSVILPEAPAVAGGLSAEELDRTVERDARRYDSGFELY